MLHGDQKMERKRKAKDKKEGNAWKRHVAKRIKGRKFPPLTFGQWLSQWEDRKTNQKEKKKKNSKKKKRKEKRKERKKTRKRKEFIGRNEKKKEKERKKEKEKKGGFFGPPTVEA